MRPQRTKRGIALLRQVLRQVYSPAQCPTRVATPRRGGGSALSWAANHVGGAPTRQYEDSQNRPPVRMAVSRNGEVIADHEEYHGHYHEGVVLRAQLRARPEREVRQLASLQRRDHFSLRRKYSHPNVQRH